MKILVNLNEHFEVIVVHKPSGLPVLPSGDFLRTTQLHILREYYQNFGDSETSKILAPIHRLGRGTSGALIFAKTKSSLRSLNTAMQKRQIEKYYLALASGTDMEDDFTVTKPIGPVAYPHISHTETIYAATDNGKPSTSIYKVLRKDMDKEQSLLQVKIPTGRPHQIRIHTAYHGYPLVGDPLYGKGGLPKENKQLMDSEGRYPVPGDCGYWLHSWKISFPHPTTKEIVNIICEPPLPLQF